MKSSVFPSWLKIVSILILAVGLPRLAVMAEPKLLVVSTTSGFRHSSIGTAEKVLADLAKQSGLFTVDFVQQPPNEPREPAKPKAADGSDTKYKEALAEYDAAKKVWNAALRQTLLRVNADTLKNYDGIIFANTTGDLPVPDAQAILDWLETGKAFIGMHSASDTFHNYRPFVEMLGGEFKSHGAQVQVDCINQDRSHPACQHLPPVWTIHDEIYVLRSFNRSQVHGLLTLDREPNAKTPGDYAVAWCKDYGRGRVFYTSLGHREDVWQNPIYQQHILGGIRWALRLSSGPEPVSLSPGFRPLFNNKDLSGWQLRHKDGAASWSVESGALKNTLPPSGHGTDLVSTDKFWNFTVRYEYQVAPGSNSGLYLRGRHEIQILDDFAKGKPENGGNGAIYNVAPVATFASKNAGEWQNVEATIVGDKISVVLNGVKVHDAVACDRATGGELDAKLQEPGPMMLQGDHGAVSFRNVQIKVLD